MTAMISVMLEVHVWEEWTWQGQVGLWGSHGGVMLGTGSGEHVNLDLAGNTACTVEQPGYVRENYRMDMECNA